MQFARVVEVYDQIEATTKRLEMTASLVGLLRDTPPEDLDKVVYLTQGKIHADYMGIELGLAEKMVTRVLAHATGLEEDRIEKLWKEKGDLAGPGDGSPHCDDADKRNLSQQFCVRALR